MLKMTRNGIVKVPQYGNTTTAWVGDMIPEKPVDYIAIKADIANRVKPVNFRVTNILIDEDNVMHIDMIIIADTGSIGANIYASDRNMYTEEHKEAFMNKYVSFCKSIGVDPYAKRIEEVVKDINAHGNLGGWARFKLVNKSLFVKDYVIPEKSAINNKW